MTVESLFTQTGLISGGTELEHALVSNERFRRGRRDLPGDAGGGVGDCELDNDPTPVQSGDLGDLQR